METKREVDGVTEVREVRRSKERERSGSGERSREQFMVFPSP